MMRRILIAAVTCFVLFGGLLAIGTADAAEERFTFDETCGWSHSLNDDPIVYPREPGASHLHEFFGSTQTDAYTTYKKLRDNPGLCRRDPDNRSAYWVPALYENGVRVPPVENSIYYRAVGKSGIVAFPKGFKMITDDAVVQLNGNGTQTVLTITFPDCGNGEKDSTDHRSHMAFSTFGVCPSTHPVAYPKINFNVRYGRVLTGAVTFAGGAQPHADFFTGWDISALEALIQSCLVEGRDINDECRALA